MVESVPDGTDQAIAAGASDSNGEPLFVHQISYPYTTSATLHCVNYYRPEKEGKISNRTSANARC